MGEGVQRHFNIEKGERQNFTTDDYVDDNAVDDGRGRGTKNNTRDKAVCEYRTSKQNPAKSKCNAA